LWLWFLATPAFAASSLVINVSPNGASTNLEAGNIARFNITVTNTGDTPAFDVVVTDTPPAEFNNCLLNGTTGGAGVGDPFAGGYTFTTYPGVTPNGLDPNASVVLDVQCNLVAAVEDNTSYANHAGAVWSDSLGGPLLPQVQHNASVSTRRLVSTKTIIATSEAHTSESAAGTAGDPRPLVVGEIVRYRVVVDVLQGIPLNVVLTDLLPTGLEYVAGNRTLVGLVSNSGTNLQSSGVVCGAGTAARVGDNTSDLSALGLDCVVTPAGGVGSGGDPVFNFGTVNNSEHDGNSELIVLEFNARVVGDVPTGTQFNNQVSLTTNRDSITSTIAVAVQRAPDLAITKDVIPASVASGGRVQYVITLNHSGSSGANAYDVAVTDVLPANLTYDNLAGITGPQAPAGQTCTVAGTVINDGDPNGAGLSVSFNALTQGHVCEIRYFATTAGGLPAATAITNTAIVNYSSLPVNGTTPNPTGSNPGAEQNRSAQDQATVTIEVPSLVKSIAATSLTETPEGTTDTTIDPRPTNVGERVRYRLVTRWPEGGLTGVAINDQLPAGMTYVAGTGRIAFVTNLGGMTANPALVCSSGTLAKTGSQANVGTITPDCAVEPAGGPFAPGTDPVWSLGTVTNNDGDADNEFVIVEFEAVVANDIANQDAVVRSGPYDVTAGAVNYVSNVIANMVREPQVNLTLAAVPNPVDTRSNATPTVRISATLQNQGTGPAFQVGGAGGGFRIVLPTGLAGISVPAITTSGAVFNNGTGTAPVTANLAISTTTVTNDTITFTPLLQMATGATLTVAFDAVVQGGTAPGTVLNGAGVVVYSSLPTGNQTNGTRNGADQANGVGNTPLTNNAVLNDYRGEGALVLSVASEAPAIDIVHDVSAGPVNQGGVTHSLTYRLTVRNTGDTSLNTVSVTDDLVATFGSGGFTIADVRVTSPGNTLVENTSYTGAPGGLDLLLSTSTLAAGVTGIIEIDLVVNPAAGAGTYSNSATARGNSVASGVQVTDTDPSDVTLSSTNARIGLAKAASASTSNGDGTFTTTITHTVQNLGTDPINNVRVTDAVATRIAPATLVRVEALAISGSLSSVDATFNGAGNVNLLPGNQSLPAGQSATITFRMVFNPSGNPGPFQNLSVATGETPTNPTPGTPNLSDTSTDGLNPDPDGNGNPGDNSTPTPITYTPGANGTVDITDTSVPGDTLQLVVVDADENTDPNATQSFTVLVTNDRTGEQETRTVTETGLNTSRFEGTLPTVFGTTAGPNQNGTMTTQQGDTVTITYNDRLTNTGGAGTRTDTGNVLGVAGIAGFAWLDEGQNDVFDADEAPLVGWTIRAVRNGATVREITVNADGSYAITNLTPGTGYSVVLMHPQSGATYNLIENISLTPLVTVGDQNLPIDPSGTVYNSATRVPLAGVVVNMTSAASGQPLPAACLLPGQQGQTTGTDGFYRFDLQLGARAECPSGGTFLIVPQTPAGFNPGYSTVLPPQPGSLDPTGRPDPVQIGANGSPPPIGAPAVYFVSFTLSIGDPNVVWNHIPLDPQSAQTTGVQLTKQAVQRSTSVGGLVAYTLTIRNNTPIALPGVSIVDQLPAGFSYVDDSAALTDGAPVTVSGSRPVTFSGFSLGVGQAREIRYVTRVSAGVVHGEYVNTATPFVGPAAAGASAQATVVVVADPDFEETTIIGKVFNDADGDGWQDSALARDVTVWIWTEGGDASSVTQQTGAGESIVVPGAPADGILLGNLPGRYGVNDHSGGNRATVALSLPENGRVSRVEVSSKEGSRLVLSGKGTEELHSSAVGRGTNGQHLVIRMENAARRGGRDVRVTVVNNGFEEAGLPGVRLATVEGLLVETDAFGRFHLAGIDGGFMERGRNFIMKLDPATLPPGSEIISENPRVLRLTQGLMNQFDFAVRVPQIEHTPSRLSVKIAEMFFKPGSTEVLPGYVQSLQTIAQELRRGTIVNLWIEAYTDGSEGTEEAAALARRRADALIEALCRLAGEEVRAQIEVQVAPAGEEVSAREDHALDWLKRSVAFLLDAIVTDAHAEGGPERCLTEVCRDEQGIPVIVIENEDGTVYEPSKELPDRGRVDLNGEQVIRLDDGGVIWWTEDPAMLTPHLSLIGPAHIATLDGIAREDAEFLIYSNYSDFIGQYRLAVHSGEDTDLVKPLAVLPIDNTKDHRQMHRVVWSIKDTAMPRVDSLRYVLLAEDAEGRIDRTYPQRLLLVEGGTPHANFPENAAAIDVELGLIEQGVTIFLPGTDTEKVLAHTSHFTDFGTDLSGADRAALDDIIAALSAAPRVNIRVHGHTSTKRIAPRSRHLIADNDHLSMIRAKVVADYLRKGLGERVQNVEELGSGPRIPVADNIGEPGQAPNRRSEAVVQGLIPLQNEQVTSVPRVGGFGADAGASDAMGGYGLALARNDLDHHVIPVYGSRVRLQGNNLGGSYCVRVRGEEIPLDAQGKFAVEHLLPVGDHRLPLEVCDAAGATVRHDMAVNVSGRYRFLVALADLTLSDSNVGGSLQPLSVDDRYDEDMLIEGRLAFYLKGKIQGKYLVTAQLDTQEQELEDIFDDIHRKDAQSLFRRLDPDQYYPVYGDDSTTIADVNTHGRMYARVEWDRSDAVWGNYETGLTGNEVVQYSRGLYGARGHYNSLGNTRFGDTKTTATIFGSENQTALGHSEFLGTGGSLYYLRHTDVLPGSDKARIEVRDPRTNRVIDNRPLVQGLDYEIDELQGRLILSRPLLQIAQGHAPSLINDGALDGNQVILVVDYEYVPDAFDTNQVVVGGAARQWIGDHVAVGVTAVDEGRAGEDYQLGGVDVTVKAAENTWAKLEYGKSKATQTNRFLSNDGGLTFSTITTTLDDRKGDAASLDVHVNAGDFGGPENWITNAWAKDVDDNYSVARRDDGANVKEVGVETQMPIGENWKVGARASHYEVTSLANEDRVAATVATRIGERGTLTSEVQHAQTRSPLTGNAEATLGAVQYEHRVTDRIAVYGGGQGTIDASSEYDNNDQLHVGTRIALSEHTRIETEVRDGHRGTGALAGIEHRLNEAHTLYGTMTHSTDTTEDPFDLANPSMLNTIGTNYAVGHRWQINDRARLFSEGQFSRGMEGSGLGHAFGLDYALPKGWNAGFTLQENELQTTLGSIDRSAYSVGIGHTGNRHRYASRVEYREDEGAGQSAVQWLTTNRVDFRLTESYRAAAKVNYARTRNRLTDDTDGKLIEGSVGIAYRPVNNNRLNWIGRYTYLYDLQSFGQENAETDRKLQVISWEAIYQFTRNFDLGLKLARRDGSVRFGRDAGPWFDATANFAAGSVRWHVMRNWDALLEYRWLQTEENDSERGGLLVSLDRHLTDNFRVGVGYSFVDFSDDLTNVDYDFKGWFLNAVGKY
jgi:uncharacterized repeat protein (TIGR01451 family)/fimbrial isopeptide formation D2 family protein